MIKIPRLSVVLCITLLKSNQEWCSKVQDASIPPCAPRSEELGLQSIVNGQGSLGLTRLLTLYFDPVGVRWILQIFLGTWNPVHYQRAVCTSAHACMLSGSACDIQSSLVTLTFRYTNGSCFEGSFYCHILASIKKKVGSVSIRKVLTSSAFRL